MTAKHQVRPRRSPVLSSLALTLGLIAAAPPSARAQPSAPDSPQPTGTALPWPGAAAAAPSDEPRPLIPSTFALKTPTRSVAFRLNAELGTIGVLKHTIQFSQDGTQLDYVREGGQDNLSFFARISAELELFRRHSFIFLYQPLDLRTEQVLSRDVSIDKLTFPAGTPVDFRYGFDFYRFSYQFDFLKSARHELALGLGIQIRNANISFTSADGTLRRINHNIGPVPLLRLRARYTFDSGVFLGTEIDGLYARGKVITGSLYSFEGALLDASVRVGLVVSSFLDVYLNLRYLGGGASGVSENDPPPGDGYTDNWLHTLTASIGFTIR
ncbi:MAG: hypothetical protein U1A78_00335 [Polyangia bacterium]